MLVLALAVFLCPTQPAAAEPPKVALLGVSAPGAVGERLSEVLEEELTRKRGAAYRLIPKAAAQAGLDLETSTLKRLVAAGRKLGAHKVVLVKASYQRVRAVEPKETVRTVSRDVTEWVDETAFEEAPNPQWEEWRESLARKGAGVVGAAICGGGLGGLFCGAAATTLADKLAQPPKTIQRQIVRKVPKTKSVTEELYEPAREDDAKPGTVKLFAASLIVDVRTGKVVARDAVDYAEELEPLWDSLESDVDLERRAAKAAAEALSVKLHEKLRR